jgi:hypothetical protein
MQPLFSRRKKVSQTTLRTAPSTRTLHRRYAGIELDAAHFKTTSDRMANHCLTLNVWRPERFRNGVECECPSFENLNPYLFEASDHAIHRTNNHAK